jgi:hypothetical protein
LEEALLRPIGAAVLLMLAVLPVAACNNDTTSPTTIAPTTSPTTSPTTITDTFNGNLNPNGAVTFSFAVGSAGTVTATLTTIGTANAVGILLGSFDTSTNSCFVAVSNDRAVQGSMVTASSSAATTACVRVYDAAGTVTTVAAFTVTVTHP